MLWHLYLTARCHVPKFEISVRWSYSSQLVFSVVGAEEMQRGGIVREFLRKERVLSLPRRVDMMEWYTVWKHLLQEHMEEDTGGVTLLTGE
jgi:hypothetical protein